MRYGKSMSKKNSKKIEEAYSEFLNRERIVVQAYFCQTNKNYAMAAILWRRLNNNVKADICEELLLEENDIVK
jgi:hypothetical protein